MRRFLILVTLAIGVGCCSAAVAAEGIAVENDGRVTLQVYMLGVKDKSARGPYVVQPRQVVHLAGEPGIYYVVTQKPDKTRQRLGWLDWSKPDAKNPYKLSLCVACSPGERAPRLGVCVIDGRGGVTVIQVLDDSPRLHAVVGDTSKTYHLNGGKAVITSINGKPTRNTAEFLKVLAESPQRAELTVSSLRGEIVEQYWVDLAK